MNTQTETTQKSGVMVETKTLEIEESDGVAYSRKSKHDGEVSAFIAKAQSTDSNTLSVRVQATERNKLYGALNRAVVAGKLSGWKPIQAKQADGTYRVGIQRTEAEAQAEA